MAGDPRHRGQKSRERAKEKGLPADQRKAPDKLVEGPTGNGWKAALGALAVAYPDRIGANINQKLEPTTYTDNLTGSPWSFSSFAGRSSDSPDLGKCWRNSR